MSPTNLYKVLDRDGRSFHGGNGVWHKNMWRGVSGPLVPCENGLHLCRAEHLVMWLGPTIWRAEYAGEMIELDDKVVARRARVTEKIETWNERTARLFAADCAEHVLHLYEQEYPNDDRPRAAIKAARDFAEGLIDAAALDAAGGAAWADAWDAAGTAAWDAASSWDAAWDAERAWQTRRLLDYLEGRAG